MIMEITRDGQINLMLRDLESGGFHLYYCDKNKNWTLQNDEPDYSEFTLTGDDKDFVIIRGWEYLFKG